MKFDLFTIPDIGDDFNNKNCYPDDWECRPQGGGGPCGPGADCYPSDCTPDRTHCDPDYCYPDKCFPQK